MVTIVSGCIVKWCYLLFFFFQAEDGIRDGHVTGVQTCALPICRRHRPPARAREARDRPLLLREPDPARDRRGPRRDRVADLPAAHQGGAAPALATGGGSAGGDVGSAPQARRGDPSMHKAADRIRNVALVGHRGAGKTSLHEALLY